MSKVDCCQPLKANSFQRIKPCACDYAYSTTVFYKDISYTHRVHWLESCVGLFRSYVAYLECFVQITCIQICNVFVMLDVLDWIKPHTVTERSVWVHCFVCFMSYLVNFNHVRSFIVYTYSIQSNLQTVNLFMDA